VDVYINNKIVYLKTAVPLNEESEVVRKMGEIMKTIPGIRGIEVVTPTLQKSRTTQVLGVEGEAVEAAELYH